MPDARSLAHPLALDTADDVEWARLLDALAERCASAAGAQFARAWPFAAFEVERARVERLHREACSLLRRGAPLPVGDVPEVSGAVERLRAGAVLEGGELRALCRVLDAARVLRRFLSAHGSLAPALLSAYATDPTLDRVADRLAESFEPDGTLADRASPRLGALRADYRAARERLLNRLQDAIARHASIVQDAFVTEREGRFVVPVRSDAHERFQGIVHGTSASGATLFVEPRAVVPLGNRLKVLEGEVAAEVQAVLSGLTERLRDVLPSLVGAVRALAEADARGAVARLGADLDLEFPVIAEDARLDLRRVRHPLLLLRHKGGVVPSDLSISTRNALVVSGPNAGGKTVALKAMGLAALMVRAALPIAADPESSVGLFDRVLTDVGDAQSLQTDLSTFSAHVRNLVAILDAADERTLVLLDEVAGGTDPKEGEALAAGLLDSLCSRGAAVVVTTHYEGLKVLALGDPRFSNASVGFDFATMTPTFRVAMGLPGRSAALAVARRFGMPGTVLERAERFLRTEEVAFEVLVEKLQRERAAVELAREAVERELVEATREREALRRALEEAKLRDRAAVEKELEDFRRRLRAAKEELRHARDASRQNVADARAEGQATVDRLAREVALGGALERLPERDDRQSAPGLEPSKVVSGKRVYVERMPADADVLEVLPGGLVRVAAGALKLVVQLSELGPARSTHEERATEPRRPGAKRSAQGLERPSVGASPFASRAFVRTAEATCDLRGMRTDDALACAASFVDRVLARGEDVAFLLHGHGTGALKEALRRELAAAKSVRFVRPAEPAEGGDAFTIVGLG